MLSSEILGHLLQGRRVTTYSDTRGKAVRQLPVRADARCCVWECCPTCLVKKAHRQFMNSNSTGITICVHAVVLEAGGPEFLKTKSRVPNAKTLHEQPVRAYYYMCSPSSSKAGGPEFLKANSRATDA